MPIRKVPLSRLKCRHCRQEPATRPRQLCWSCYYTPAIRRRYKPVSKFSQHNLDVTGARPLPAKPTSAPPGSAAKILVLMGRAARNNQLWHPADARDVDADTVRLPEMLGPRKRSRRFEVLDEREARALIDAAQADDASFHTF